MADADLAASLRAAAAHIRGAAEEGFKLAARLERMALSIACSGLTLDHLALRVKTYNALKKYGLFEVRDLICLTDPEFLRIPNCGKVALREIGDALGEFGLALGMGGADEERKHDV